MQATPLHPATLLLLLLLLLLPLLLPLLLQEPVADHPCRLSCMASVDDAPGQI
jgi:hypothetical protein